MSLINEALKRARETQRQQASPAGPSLVALQPVETAAPVRPSYWLVPLALSVLLLLGCWFLWLGWRGSGRAAVAPRLEVGHDPEALGSAVADRTETTNGTNGTNARPAMDVESAKANALAAAAERTKAPLANLEATNPPPAEGDEAQALAASPVPPPAPRFELEGIFYRPANPSALINGAGLFVGDEIDGAKVISIEPHTVSLLVAGKTNVLTIR